MRRVLTAFIFIALVLSMTSLAVNASTVTYSGTVNPFKLGQTATTAGVTKFNSSLGTLTGVQIDLSLTVTPYAMVMNFGSSPVAFTTSDSIIFGYDPTNIWTISHVSDSWNLTAPTVSTGTIMGSGQMVAPWVPLTFVGGTSAPVNLTALALSANLAEYVGTDPLGLLILGTTGSGQVLIHDGPLYGGGGGNLVGGVSVTYTYIPEPATMCLLGLGVLGLLKKRRA